MSSIQSGRVSPSVKYDRSQGLYVPARSFTYDELAALYNQTRLDYIVPMPMNGKRMADYVQQYDVDLDASTLSLAEDRMPRGVIMLALREDRSWITRLGLVAEQRRHKVGQSLMEKSIENSRQRHVNRIQLEVIKGNEPAYRLFEKLGFTEIGELKVIRRPPGMPGLDIAPAVDSLTPLDASGIQECLSLRDERVAWTEETSSLLKSRDLRGMAASLPTGENGWLVYQYSAFELTHVALNPAVSEDMALALLYSLHKQYPMHDTKIENVPVGHTAVPAFRALGYLDAFSRIEMVLHLR
ncbi:MAG TPA: GNAT family N-acetyltransferase [Aggregatilineales bacterium]|nr:GNAT family N-acetyltransferase [Aggregatilineales bacterium]